LFIFLLSCVDITYRRTARATPWDRLRPIRNYAILAVSTSAGMYFTNWSLEYLNYPTRIMFKSSKVIPVMLAGAVMQGKK
jgi:adenosine 3'-phospho 5'-phosphosulfate transporter B3